MVCDAGEKEYSFPFFLKFFFSFLFLELTIMKINDDDKNRGENTEKQKSDKTIKRERKKN